MSLKNLNTRISKLQARHAATEELETQQTVIELWTDEDLARALAKRGQAPLDTETDTRPWPRTVGDPPDLRIVYRTSDGQPSNAEIDRLLEGKVSCGCMLLPVFGDGSMEDWEAGVLESQRRLKAAVRQ